MCVFYSAQSTVYDSRIFPFLQRPYSRYEEKQSRLYIEANFTTANRAFGRSTEGTVGIPHLFGSYDLNQIANSLQMVTGVNPLRSEWRNNKIPYFVGGKIQSQGCAFSWDQHIYKALSGGISTYFMRVNSRQHFLYDEAEGSLQLTSAQRLELEQERLMVHQALGLEEQSFDHTGFGDINLYLRLGKIIEYSYKFRRIDFGLRCGGLIATGKSMEITNAASVPFGGNGHHGIYVGFDAEFELKEDWVAGLLVQLNKRFARERCVRMPSLFDRRACSGEHQLFAAIVGPACIDPGVTVIFSPYCMLEDIRDGLGFKGQYTLTSHARDRWKDERPCNRQQELPTGLNAVRKTSSWASDYITLNVFYDCAKTRVGRSWLPMVYAAWDLPGDFLIGHNYVRNHRVSIGVQFTF